MKSHLLQSWTRIRSAAGRHRAGILAATAVAFSTSLWAQQPVAEVSTAASASFIPGCSNESAGATAQSTSCQVSFFARDAQSQASAAPGVLRVDAFAAADAPNVNLGAMFAYGFASAAFRDSLTWIGPANTRATVTGLLSLHGSVIGDTWGSPFSGFATANYSFSGGLFGQNFGFSGTWHDSADGSSYIVNPSLDLLMPVSFVLDFDGNGRSAQGSFSMWLRADAYADARGTSDPTTRVFLPGHSLASAAFANTVYWAGIASVVDANGVAITGLRSESASGFDYMQSAFPSVTPVPEPSTAALMGVALLGMAVWRRRPVVA